MSVPGSVRQIRTFPVKSLDGACVDSADIAPDGLRGDRAWAVLDADGEPLRAKSHPRLADVLARATPDGPQLLLPGRRPLAARDAGPALAELLGTGPLTVAPVPGGARQVAAVHVVAAAELEQVAACAAEDPRANLVLDLPGAPDRAAWPGARLRVGGAVLLVERLPRHCAGAYAAVLRPGRVRTGDPASLEPAHAPAPASGGLPADRARPAR